MRHTLVAAGLAGLLAALTGAAMDSFPLAKDGTAAAVIVTPATPDANEAAGIKDLVEFVEKISGAKLAVLKPDEAPPAGLGVIRVGLAQAAPVQALLDKVKGAEGGYVIAIRGQELFLAGQSPLATSFACSELLERLGCRWFMPGPLGEVYPKRATLAYQGDDVVDQPDFNPRWLRLDPEWSRRNKLGGATVPAAHSFANFVDAGKDFAAHPEWFPLRNGVRQPRGQLCLSNPELIQRIIAQVKDQFRKNPGLSGASLGPNDGGGWCECEKCAAMDSGRIDPFHKGRDMIDRQIKMMNAVITEVEKEFPGKKYGFYVYADYQLPPVTVKPHPSIVPVFAPITYCRLHSMFNPLCPDGNAVRVMFDGWAKFGLEMHFRGYTFNLAGLQTPFHYFHKWTEEMPWMKAHNIKGFFPESIQSWSANGPHYWLCARLAWRVNQDPRVVIKEFCDGVFGPAGAPMERYFWRMAEAVRDADHHTGNDFNYPQIYTAAIMPAGQQDLTAAAKAAGGEREAQCVRLFQMAHDYLQAFLDMQRLQNEYEFAQSKAALDRLVKLQDDLIGWDARWLSSRAAKSYLRRFWGPAVEEAAAKTSGGGEVVARFPDEWQFILDPNEAGEWLGLHEPRITGGGWKPIKTFSASWADQGLNYYSGVGWYKTTVNVPARFQGREVMLWFGAIDEAVQVYLNGRKVTWEVETRGKQVTIIPGAPGDAAGEQVIEAKTGDDTVKRETRDTLSGAWRPLEMPVTRFLTYGADNTVAVRAVNKQLNEMGTGGIFKVVMLYAKPPVAAPAAP